MTAFTPYSPDTDISLDIGSDLIILSEDDLNFLSAFIDSTYLIPDTLDQICESFVEDSQVHLADFLCAPLAKRLEEALLSRDSSDGLSDQNRSGKIPAHKSGTAGEALWSIQGPPHKFRYCSLSGRSHKLKTISDALSILSSAESSAEDILAVLQDTLFPHPAFKTWLTLAAKAVATSYAVRARRFRPGLDYTLATSHDEQSILDVVLHLTPEVEATAKPDGKGKGKAEDTEDEDEDGTGWAKGEWGGWDVRAEQSFSYE